MARPRYTPVDPGKLIRDLRKEFKRLQTKEEPGPERAELLAAFTRSAHLERQLNMAMHTATQCLEEDPDAPDLLVAAYLPPDLKDPEERLRTLVDLRDLARYVEHDALRSFVDEHIDDEARAWVRDASDQERKHRLRTLTSMFGREFADQLRDELELLY